MTRVLFCLLLPLLLGGCSSLAYYSQAVSGHLEVMHHARSIDALVDDPATDPKLRQQLAQVKAIRQFASKELGLPDNESYRHYADLGRPFVVWNVTAAPELSLRPQQWCMPVVGCVSYRGFYDRGDAERLATQLRQQGFDTYVGGVPAYSTLGFFSDPVLNTFLRFGEVEVARLIFHELAHQVAFAEGDSVFNESFATAVEQEGLRRWLLRTATPERRQALAIHQRQREQFMNLTTRYRDQLAEIYRSDRTVEAKRAAKAKTIGEMREAYAELKASWGGDSGYDAWFAHDLNNAKLSSLAVYTHLVPAFEKLLAAEGGDMRRFFERVAGLTRLSGSERLAALNDPTPKAAPGLERQLAANTQTLPQQ